MWLGLTNREGTWTAIPKAVILAPLAAVGWLMLSGVLLSDVPWAGRALVAGMAVLAAVRPTHALTIVAGLGPLLGVIGDLAGMPFGLAEPLVVAYLTPWLTRHLLTGRSASPWPIARLLTPVGLLAMVVAASSVVWLAALQPFVGYPSEFLVRLLSFLGSRYFADHNTYSALNSGLYFLEGLGLFASAAILGNEERTLGSQLVRMTVAGGAGTAVMSLNRLTEISLRNQDTWQAFWQHLATLRISAAFPDVNAAGSFFAMGAIAAAGVGLAAVGFRRVSMIMASAVMLLAVWLTGSRSALFAVPMAVATLVLFGSRTQGWSGRRRAALVGGLALPLVAAAVMLPFVVNASKRIAAADTLRDRLDLSRAAVRMAADYPVFGVGVGRYKPLSEAYFTPQLKRLFVRENAHNNFLQVLAELGIVGFVPFLWVLGGTGSRLFAAARRHPTDWVLQGTLGGLCAFVVTWVTGHPLLVAEVSFAFWILLGGCAGLARPVADTSSAPGPVAVRLRSFAAAALAALLLVTMPSRMATAVASMDLADAAIGYCDWQVDSEGTESRWIIRPRSQFYFRANTAGARLPLRLVAPGRTTAADVSLYLNDRLINRVRLAPGAWHTVAIMMPPDRDGPFYRVEIDVGDAHAPTNSCWERDAGPGIQMARPLVIPRERP